uniref:Secreted protein n=1 Tax=Panagrellus redivivus TaxID=6233 RepID=A0A7E4ZWV0_PANRE
MQSPSLLEPLPKRTWCATFACKPQTASITLASHMSPTRLFTNPAAKRAKVMPLPIPGGFVKGSPRKVPKKETTACQFGLFLVFLTTANTR